MESLLRAIRALVDAELEELKVLQTTILLVTTSHALPDVSLSQVRPCFFLTSNVNMLSVLFLLLVMKAYF